MRVQRNFFYVVTFKTCPEHPLDSEILSGTIHYIDSEILLSETIPFLDSEILFQSEFGQKAGACSEYLISERRPFIDPCRQS